MRSLKQIESDINRTRGHIRALDHHTFSEEEKVTLEPRYKKELKQLQDELADAIKNIKVDYEEVSADRSNQSDEKSKQTLSRNSRRILS